MSKICNWQKTDTLARKGVYSLAKCLFYHSALGYSSTQEKIAKLWSSFWKKQ